MMLFVFFPTTTTVRYITMSWEGCRWATSHHEVARQKIKVLLHDTRVMPVRKSVSSSESRDRLVLGRIRYGLFVIRDSRRYFSE